MLRNKKVCYLNSVIMSNSVLFSNFQNSDFCKKTNGRRNGKIPMMRCISSGNFKFNCSPLTFLLVIGLLVSNTVCDFSVNFIPNKIYPNPNNNFNNENNNNRNKASVINSPTDSATLNNRGYPSQNQNQSHQQNSRELFPGKNDNLESVVAGNSNLNLNRPIIKLFERSHRSNIQFSLEDEICLGNYDVSEGTIIRTHDSQKLGAKYLNETDLGQGVKSRDECLRLCCQTPHCNVNVFEEKKSGSCYMFDCGPPEDFRCKFTSQPHYTSAILRKTLPILPNLNQHETELSQLRSVDGPEGSMNKGMEFSILNEPMSPGKNKFGDMDMESIGNGGGGTVATTTSTTTTTAASSLQQQQQQQQNSQQLYQQQQQLQQQQQQQQQRPAGDPQPLQQRRSQCTRNQFECKASGECIAIYNACDGVPQCADGSDESPDLHCPDTLMQSPIIQPQKIIPVSQSNVPLPLNPGSGSGSGSSSPGSNSNGGGGGGSSSPIHGNIFQNNFQNSNTNHHENDGHDHDHSTHPHSHPHPHGQEEYRYGLQQPIPPQHLQQHQQQQQQQQQLQQSLSPSLSNLPNSINPHNGNNNNNNGNAGGKMPNGNGDQNSNFPLQQQQQQQSQQQQQQQQQQQLLSSGPGGLQPQQQQQQQQGSQSSLNIFSHKDGGIMDEAYGSQLTQQRHLPYWKQQQQQQSSSFDYNAGDLGGGTIGNGNLNNGYGPPIVPLGNYGSAGNSNNNNNYGNGPPYSSYGQQQYPFSSQLNPPPLPPPQQQQQQQQQQQFGLGPFGNNNLNLPGQSQPNQQQLPGPGPGQYYNNQATNSNLNLNPNSPGFLNMQNSNSPAQNAAAAAQAQINQVSFKPNQNLNQGNPLHSKVEATSSGNGSVPVPAVLVSAPSSNGVSYNEISKLELPQGLRTLSSQIQHFASESENDVSAHNAGPGAVLAFIMGVGMSIIMVIIVGCRLRRIGTRRRGKNRLDPDYLVDGMYL